MKYIMRCMYPHTVPENKSSLQKHYGCLDTAAIRIFLDVAVQRFPAASRTLTHSCQHYYESGASCRGVDHGLACHAAPWIPLLPPFTVRVLPSIPGGQVELAIWRMEDYIFLCPHTASSQARQPEHTGAMRQRWFLS